VYHSGRLRLYSQTLAEAVKACMPGSNSLAYLPKGSVKRLITLTKGHPCGSSVSLSWGDLSPGASNRSFSQSRFNFYK